MMKYTFLPVIVLLAAAQPAGVPGFYHWTSSELKSYESKLKANEAPNKIASQSLGNWGNSMGQITRRDGNGEAEWHENFVDIFVVEAGEATLQVGGEVVGGKTTAPGEIRGPSIQGGEKVTLKTGDIVRIPAKTAHQLFVPKSFLYFVLKVKP
jgi:mannose-6-phosphate isomerase-like protein (cupin superfamily)